MRHYIIFETAMYRYSVQSLAQSSEAELFAGSDLKHCLEHDAYNNLKCPLFHVCCL